jgi:hypothetical protein
MPVRRCVYVLFIDSPLASLPEDAPFESCIGTDYRVSFFFVHLLGFSKGTEK